MMGLSEQAYESGVEDGRAEVEALLKRRLKSAHAERKAAQSSMHDHLAALAMQGNLSCAGDKMRAVKLGTPKDLREFAVLNHDIADAMMAERERRQT